MDARIIQASFWLYTRQEREYMKEAEKLGGSFKSCQAFADEPNIVRVDWSFPDSFKCDIFLSWGRQHNEYGRKRV